jgi:hypothetical protein
MMGLLYEGGKTMAGQFAPDQWWWEYHPDTKERIALTSKTGDVLLATGDERHSWLVVAEDKARLIEAVPALLEVCRSIVKAVGDKDLLKNDDFKTIGRLISLGELAIAVRLARSVIAKATQPDA